MKKHIFVFLLASLMMAAALALPLPSRAQDRPPLHPAVKDLCKTRYPGHEITAFSGFGNDDAGQWALVLSKEGQHLLAVVEKAKDEPAYHLTIENPGAFMPGDSRPSVFIDTGGGDSLFLSFTKDNQHWSFHAVKSGGAWGQVNLILRTTLDEENAQEWLMDEADGWLHAEEVLTDGNDNVKARASYPMIPVPQLAGRLLLSNFHWQSFPSHPNHLLTGSPPASESLAALTPAGWTLTHVDLNWGGIYLLGRDQEGITRLMLKRWQPGGAEGSKGRFVDTLSRPLPDSSWCSAQVNGQVVYLYTSEAGPGFTLAWDGDGRWRLAFVMGVDWFAKGPRYLFSHDHREANYFFGELPWDDIREIDLAAIPLDFEGAMKQLDQSQWAVVNNPNPKDRLHLRSQPEKQAASRGKFYNGTPMKVLARKGAWVQVDLAGLSGWMMADYLAFGPDMNQVRPAFPGLVGLDSLDHQDMPLYSSPDEGSPVIARRNISYSTSYWIIGVHGEDWLYVYFFQEDLGGYMKKEWFWEGNG